MTAADGWQVHDEAGRRKYLSGAERARFLGAADCLPPPMQALCHVLAYAGCRISEALALTIHQVDAERLALTIRTLKRRRVVGMKHLLEDIEMGQARSRNRDNA